MLNLLQTSSQNGFFRDSQIIDPCELIGLGLNAVFGSLQSYLSSVILRGF